MLHDTVCYPALSYICLTYFKQRLYPRLTYDIKDKDALRLDEQQARRGGTPPIFNLRYRVKKRR